MKKFEITFRDGTKEIIKALSQWEAIYSVNICSHKVIVGIREVN